MRKGLRKWGRRDGETLKSLIEKYEEEENEAKESDEKPESILNETQNEDE